MGRGPWKHMKEWTVSMDCRLGVWHPGEFTINTVTEIPFRGIGNLAWQTSKQASPSELSNGGTQYVI